MEERLGVKGARLLAGFTQAEMAAAMGVHAHTYRKFEREPMKMTIDQAIKFCSIVKRSFAVIFFDVHSS